MVRVVNLQICSSNVDYNGLDMENIKTKLHVSGIVWY